MHGINVLQADTHAPWGTVICLGMLDTGAIFSIYYYRIEHFGPVCSVSATYIAQVVALAIGAPMGESVGFVE